MSVEDGRELFKAERSRPDTSATEERPRTPGVALGRTLAGATDREILTALRESKEQAE